MAAAKHYSSTGREIGPCVRGFSRLRRFAVSCIRIYLAVLLLLFLLENKLIFPAPRFPSGDWEPTWLQYEDVAFASADGTKLHGWYLDHPAPKGYLLYCHGNGEHVAYVGPIAEHLRSMFGRRGVCFRLPRVWTQRGLGGRSRNPGGWQGGTSVAFAASTRRAGSSHLDGTLDRRCRSGRSRGQHTAVER